MSERPSRAASRRSRTVKLYVPNGLPSGVVTIEPGISSVGNAVTSAFGDSRKRQIGEGDGA